MCETIQSSHRLRPAMALVRVLFAPTVSGDGDGERFWASLPPSPHFSGASTEKTWRISCPEKTLKSKTLESHGGAGWELRRL
jgi:hypothetical protein